MKLLAVASTIRDVAVDYFIYDCDGVFFGSLVLPYSHSLGYSTRAMLKSGSGT